MMQQSSIRKYRPFPPVPLPDRTWPDRVLDRAPIWCSVDLRDGNQALPVPMSITEKVEYFSMLAKIGFREIELGFPSASDTEFQFARTLIERGMITDEISIQCLVQCREHLLRRTFEAIRGAPRAIIHFYNSTNPLQRRVTFNLDKEQIKGIAVEGARLAKKLSTEAGDTQIRFEYSPESFSDTELDYSLEVCEAVMEVIEPTAQNPIILNLPATVELATPNVHADQIEYFCRNLRNRECAIISLHTHNDRGTGVAATELALMAGADRVEGTLFGNGERTGNLDIVTAALNLYTQGVDPGLDFSNLPEIRALYERCTRMSVHERHPYAGDLVFTAFSGSHQDAIKKGMDALDKSDSERWEVPYLPIDPEDIGRTYKAIIRINSQSGKGGVAYVLEREFGYEMPKRMHPEFGEVVTRLADQRGNELDPQEILSCFQKEYLESNEPMQLLGYHLDSPGDDHRHVRCQASIQFAGKPMEISGEGNGPIAALVDGLNKANMKNFRVMDFRQHAIGDGSAAEAIAYLELERSEDKARFWGAGIDGNIELAGLKGLISAINRLHKNRPTG